MRHFALPAAAAFALTLGAGACGDDASTAADAGATDADDSGVSDTGAAGADAASDTAIDSALDAAQDDTSADALDAGAGGTIVRAMTFNTGTGATPPRELADTYGWGRDEADLGDAWYGNGLAWIALIDAMAPWMADQSPDVVAFQEIFWPGECDAIPAEAQVGFVCDGAREPTVAERLVGAGYTVACHPGRPDKCLAVRDAFARIDGCDDGFCLEGLDGAEVEGCSRGSRVARARLERPDGTALTVVNVHGTSGFTVDDTACRVAWFDAAFADLDPDVPAIVLGDFNTDPVRAAATDASASRLAELADEGAFAFATQVGVGARPTYGGILNIDHVLVRGGDGTCLAAGLDEALPAPLAVEAFDHRPIVCDLTLR